MSDKPKRPRNPRLVALRLLRDLVKVVQAEVYTWNVSGTVWIPQDQRQASDSGRMADAPWRRPRRPDEYPEVSLDAWLGLYAWAIEYEQRAAEIKKHAAEQYHALKNRQAVEDAKEATQS